MTGRERLLATVRHGQADRVPWASKFGTWLAAHRLRGDLPGPLARCEHWHDAARRMGIGIFDKAGAVYREVRDGEREVDDETRTVYLTGYPVRSAADLRTWRSLLEAARCEACSDDWLAADRAAGDDGIDMANLPDSPLHRVFVTMMGYEAGSLAFADLPREMDAVCRLVLAKNEEAYAVAMASPAEVLVTGERARPRRRRTRTPRCPWPARPGGRDHDRRRHPPAPARRRGERPRNRAPRAGRRPGARVRAAPARGRRCPGPRVLTAAPAATTLPATTLTATARRPPCGRRSPSATTGS